MIGQENEDNSTLLTVQSLDLDFGKNKKRNKSAIICSSTDRNNNAPKPPYQTLKTDRSALIEKKKSYSNSIRQRNQNLLTKKNKKSIIEECGEFQNSQLRNLIQIKENIQIEPSCQKKQPKNKKLNHSSSKKIMFKKSFDSVCSLDIEPIPVVKLAEQVPKAQQSNIYSTSTFQITHERQPTQRQLRIDKQKLCSKVYSERVYVFDSDATTLAKQNTTFKRDLANFRKQNSQLRRQLQLAKKNVQQLEEKAKSLLEGSLNSPSKLSEQLQVPRSQSDNSSQIIQKLRQEILELKNVNSGLQLKAYMAQKRVMEQVALCKKKMAKELGDWREKCTKLRAENMKFKSFRDMTISMQISKDQQ